MNKAGLPLAGVWALAADNPRHGDVMEWAAARLSVGQQHLAAAPDQEPQWYEYARADAAQGRMPYPAVNGVAVIGVKGVLLKSFPIIGMDVATGYAQLDWQIGLALADPGVRAIALAIDSLGGTVDGLFALTPMIRAARDVKPMAAVISGAACSAGYAIAAACSVAIAHPIDSCLGSVGVRAMHVAQHRWAEAEGYDVSEMAAGARKLDFTPWQPLSAELRAEWAADLDEWREVFIADVVAGRPQISAAALRATEAAVFERPSGLAAALSLGLADALDPDPFAAFLAALDGN